MKTIAYAMPVKDDQVDHIHELTRVLLGDNRRGAEKLRDEAGIDREQVFLQTTPMGAFAIIVWDTEDVARAFDTFASSDGDHARWFRRHIAEIHGFDIASAPAPDIEVAAQWEDTDWKFGDFEDQALCFPLKPGAHDEMRKFTEALVGERRSDFERTRREFGIHRQLFVHQSTPQGDMAIMYGEGEPGWRDRAFRATSTSDEPFFRWWRESVDRFAAVSLFDAPSPPKVEPLLELTLRVPASA